MPCREAGIAGFRTRAQTRPSVLTCSLLVLACGGGSSGAASPGSPTAPGNSPGAQTCRTYAAQETRALSSSDGSVTGTISQSCSYTTSANELTCTLTHADSSGVSYTVTQLARYASSADFVDEVRVVPPLSLASTGSNTYTPAGPGVRNYTWTFSYDGQRRQTQRVFLYSDGSSQTAMHAGWDTAGRPTGATLSSPQSITLLYSYNDAARSWTITTPSVGAVQTHTFNADGNLISNVSTVGGVTTTQTVTIAATGKVCR